MRIAKIGCVVISLALLLVGCGSDNESSPTPPANTVPVVDAGADFEVVEESTVSLSGLVTDDGQITTVNWVQNSGPSVQLSNADSFDATFIAPIVTEATDLVFSLSATDNDNESASDTVSVTINRVPIATVDEAFEVLERRGEIPILDREESLTGIDSNNDGVRDDIASFIINQSLEQPQEQALFQLARSLQVLMGADLDDVVEVEKIAALNLNSVMCLMTSIDDIQIADKYLKTLEAYTANTFERSVQYDLYNAKRNGTVTRLPTNNTCL